MKVRILPGHKMEAVKRKDGSWIFVEKKTVKIDPRFVAIKMADIINLLKDHPARDTFITTLAEKAYLDNGI